MKYVGFQISFHFSGFLYCILDLDYIENIMLVISRTCFLISEHTFTKHIRYVCVCVCLFVTLFFIQES